MLFTNIEEIRNHKWIGNHAADHGAFTAVDEFSDCGSHSVADRAEAQRIKYKHGMGLDDEIAGYRNTDEQVLQDFYDSFYGDES